VSRIRREESLAAANFLQATYHESICNDLEIFYDKPTLARVAAIIRQVNPDIVLTHAPADYMEDHMNTCRLAVTAAFIRGMPNFPVQPATAAINKQVAVYHAQPYSNRDPLRRLVIPEIFVDTTDLIPLKQQQLACHASQKEWLDVSQGQDSYLQTLADLDREVGGMSSSFQFAEGWRRHLHYGFGEHDFNPLVSDLPLDCVALKSS
jgi:LmbE family N-acetylglucosaminyl deacetylase